MINNQRVWTRLFNSHLSTANVHHNYFKDQSNRLLSNRVGVVPSQLADQFNPQHSLFEISRFNNNCLQHRHREIYRVTNYCLQPSLS